MLTVAVLQQKGGSGKTMLAINLAAAAHLDGDRALVVDMDRQASAFDWSAARQDGSPLDGLSVVKADKAMALPRFKEIARGYDYVFLDGPPRLGDVTQSAAVAADVAVLPIQPGPVRLLGRRRDARVARPGRPDPRAAGAPANSPRLRPEPREHEHAPRARGRGRAPEGRRRARRRRASANRVPRRRIARRIGTHVLVDRSSGRRHPAPVAQRERREAWV